MLYIYNKDIFLEALALVLFNRELKKDNEFKAKK
ncbi:hypothetical protein U729_13 [Clostridium baratii str. Sullivan]|uniref:Uncharacterized protein n=1 Tax=Clostridium baratii str. Sullivan TaxID=1415775 RepID=A0A0A7FWR2_9CLOT|nr:hypothetical protein U729_13 [Clostridium baratii str. Sullivan]